MKNLKKILFSVFASCMIASNSGASLNCDYSSEENLRNIPLEIQSLPYCNNLFRDLNDGGKYFLLMNMITNLEEGKIDFVKINQRDCKFTGSAVFSDVPENYSFEEAYDYFLDNYVFPWLSGNR